MAALSIANGVAIHGDELELPGYEDKVILGSLPPDWMADAWSRRICLLNHEESRVSLGLPESDFVTGMCASQKLRKTYSTIVITVWVLRALAEQIRLLRSQ